MFNKDCILDHVAIAVSDLEGAIATYELLGIPFHHEREIVASQGVKVAFGHVDSNAHVELLQPVNEESPIFKYIQKNGQGIHHLCFKVPNVHEKCEELKGQGMKLIYESPVPGAGNTLVNFIHPKSTGGVLIEVSQKLI